MGLDQYFYIQKKGSAKSVLENGTEVGYLRKAWWIHSLIEGAVGKIEDCEPVRLMESDIDAVWDGIADAVFKDSAADEENYWFNYKHDLESLVVALIRMKLATHRGEQAWYYADW